MALIAHFHFISTDVQFIAMCRVIPADLDTTISSWFPPMLQYTRFRSQYYTDSQSENMKTAKFEGGKVGLQYLLPIFRIVYNAMGLVQCAVGSVGYVRNRRFALVSEVSRSHSMVSSKENWWKIWRFLRVTHIRFAMAESEWRGVTLGPNQGWR